MNTTSQAGWPIIRWLPIAFAGLTGCVAQNPARQDLDLASIDPGLFTIKAAQSATASSKPDKIEETATSDESTSFRHWQVYFFSNCGPCKTDSATIEYFFAKYPRYCAARGGQWSAEVALGKGRCTGPRPFEIRAAVYSEPNKLIQGSRIFYLLVDAFERKDGARASVDDEYRREQVGRTDNSYGFLGGKFSTPLSFWAYGKRDLAAEHLEAKREAERQIRERQAWETEAATRRATAEATYLPRAKTVGQKICRSYQGQDSYQTRMGYAHTVISQTYFASGFTERASGDRIQIRISAIQVSDPTTGRRKNIPKLQGSPELAPGVVIWDEAIEWQPCS